MHKHKPYFQQEHVEVREDNGLVIYNDNVNTFDHVVNCLMMICKHEEEQAEQCALIIHNVGKCEVKVDTYPYICSMAAILADNGLTCEIV